MARPLEFDKEDVVSRAVCVFLKHGFEAASVDDLTRELSISRASLYNSFGDKRGLLLAALDCAAQKGESYRQQLRNTPGTPAEAIEKFFRGLVRAHLEGEAPAGCIFLTVGAELAGADATIDAKVKANLDAHRENFRAVLARDSQWKPKQRERLADSLLASMLGLLVLVRVYPDPAVLDAAISQAIELIRK